MIFDIIFYLIGCLIVGFMWLGVYIELTNNYGKESWKEFWEEDPIEKENKLERFFRKHKRGMVLSFTIMLSWVSVILFAVYECEK